MTQATHWFADKLIDYNQSQDTGMMIIKIPSWEYFELKAKAKEMEKQQIEDAHIEGQRVFDKHPHTQWTNDQAEQYYNETYGSNGSDETKTDKI